MNVCLRVGETLQERKGEGKRKLKREAGEREKKSDRKRYRKREV